MALISYFAPYFLLPFAFTIAGGLLATIHGAVSNRHQGAFAALKGVRQKEAARIHQERMEGRTRGGTGVVGGLYRRTFTRGGLSFSKAGQQRFRASEQQRFGAIAAKGLETDAGFASGDDT